MASLRDNIRSSRRHPLAENARFVYTGDDNGTSMETADLTGQLLQALEKYWGYKEFRPLQGEAMEHLSRGRDVIVVLPTGGGKSVCFQAPAVLRSGLAVVISPLISLMKDQVDALTECGVAAARLDSTLTLPERDLVMERLATRELKLLYVSPERLMMDGFRDRKSVV